MEIELCLIQLIKGFGTEYGWAYHWALRVGDRIYEVGLRGKSWWQIFPLQMYIKRAPGENGALLERAPDADDETMAGWIGIMPLGTTDMSHDEIW